MTFIEDKVEELANVLVDAATGKRSLNIGEIKDDLEKSLTAALKEAQEQERERIGKLVAKYFEKGLGFNKGSINDSVFQRLKSDLLEALSNNKEV